MSKPTEAAPTSNVERTPDSLNLATGEGARLYPLLIAVLTIGMLIYIPVGMMIGIGADQLVAPYIILGGCAVSWFSYRRYDVHRAILVIVWILCVGILIQGSLRGGLANPAFHGLSVLMMIAGWLLGTRHGLYIGYASLIGTLCITLAIRAGYLQPVPSAEGMPYWFAQSTVLVLGMIMMWAVLRAHWQQVRKIGDLSLRHSHSARALSERERDLLASENRFRRMHESNPVPVTLSRIDDGRYLDVNPAWEKLFGWARDDIRGRTSLEIGFFADTEARRKGLEAFRRDGRAELEVLANCANGEQRTMMCSVERIDYSGEPAALTIMFDITERRRIEDGLRRLNDELENRVAERTEELEAVVRELNSTLTDLRQTQDDLVRSEKHASLGRLVAGIAHELNTPIGNALTASTALTGEFAGLEKQIAGGHLKRSHLEQLVQYGRAGTEIIERSLQRASSLVHSFKQVAVDQGSEQRRHFELGEIVRDVAETLLPSLTKNGLELDIDIPQGIVLDSYPGAIDQIVINLLNNTIAHAFEGRKGGRIRLSAIRDSDIVELRCSDDGVGIADNIIGRIFDPFFTTKLGRGGSGLGLAIVQQLATQVLRGQIHVESQPDSGTTFILRVPTFVDN